MTVDSAGGVGKVWVGGLAGSGLCALRPDEREALIGTSKVRNHVGRNTGAGVLLAAAIAAIALIASNTIHLSPSSDQPPPGAVALQPQNVLRVQWQRTQLAPAATAGRICITPPRHTQVCASYTIGEKPADALTRELQVVGIQVQSAG